MKILVTGANGLLGGFLVPELASHGHTVLATGIGKSRLPASPEDHQVRYLPMDITDAMEVFEVIGEFRPDCIIHAAAVTQADDCEKDPIRCWQVNVTATRFILSAARECSARLIYISTDFVFDGREGPYDEQAEPAPVNYYGSSKLQAEKAVMQGGIPWNIVRTVLVYGHSDNVARSSLMSWVASKLSKGERIRVVSDQVRTPTYAGDLAKGIRLLLEKGGDGIFHISGEDVLTPYQMAIMTAEYLDLDTSLIEEVNADVFTQPAQRPLRTGFIISKAKDWLGYDPVPFREGLRITFNGKDSSGE
jgi:dTDP-4-dehydrorhamnose reductase